jgi:hypothetical protein
VTKIKIQSEPKKNDPKRVPQKQRRYCRSKHSVGTRQARNQKTHVILSEVRRTPNEVEGPHACSSYDRRGKEFPPCSLPLNSLHLL